MSILTKKESQLLQAVITDKELTPKEADAVLKALGKLHEKANFYRKSYRVSSQGCNLWSIYKEHVLERFKTMCAQVQSQANNGYKKTTPVVMVECCQGKEKEIKRFEANNYPPPPHHPNIKNQ